MLFPVVNFLKCVVTEVFLFSIVAFKTLISFKTLTSHKVVMGSLVAVLLQMLTWFRQWNKFENRTIFDDVKAYEVMAYKKVCQLFLCHLVCDGAAVMPSFSNVITFANRCSSTSCSHSSAFSCSSLTRSRAFVVCKQTHSITCIGQQPEHPIQRTSH